MASSFACEGCLKSMTKWIGCAVEDILLWRDVKVSAGAFVGVTLLYLLLEWSGLSLLTIVSNTLLALVSIAFIWNNVANFTGK